MITKIRLKVKGHEEKTFMAEVEQTRQGYKFTMPDGSGIEIYGNLIEKLEIEQEAYTEIQPIGETQAIRLNADAPRYKEYKYSSRSSYFYRDKVSRFCYSYSFFIKIIRT